MSNFAHSTPLEQFLELISNQLQLGQRRADFEASGRGGPDRDAYLRQIDLLHYKIINQRNELKIAVEGV
jgi:hypothetical protein